MACQCQIIQAGHWELLTDVLSDKQVDDKSTPFD